MAAQAAYAQTAPSGAQPAAEGVGVAEIVVTAQRRAQSLQDVPIAISAFSGASLQERAILDVSSLSNISPNVTLDAGAPFSGSSAVLAAFIRGIGRNDFAINLDPGVGVYLDGVYLARTVGANVNLPDVERVEVLKGPQGTLFGRNTIGGAISVVTRTPGDDFAFRGDVTTGSYNRLDAQATVDLPLSSTLKSLVTFAVKNRDGYQKRIPFPSATPYATDPAPLLAQSGYGSSEREGGEGEWTLRGKLLWKPSARFRGTVAADYLHVDQSALANSVRAVVSRPGSFAGLAANDIPGTALDPTGRTGFNYVGLYNFCIGATAADIAARNAQNLCGPRGTPLLASQVLPGFGSANVDADPQNNRLPFDSRFVSTDPDKTYATGNSFSRITSYGASGTLEFDLTDAVLLKSITAYRNLKWNTGSDLDNSPLQFLETSFAQDQHQFSQELQVSGNALSKAVNFVLGAYYFTESGDEEGYATVGHSEFRSEAPASIDTKAYAAFGQVDWRVTKLLGLTAGARYTEEDKKLEAGQRDSNGFAYKLFNCVNYAACRTVIGGPDPSDPLRLYPPGVQQRKFTNFSPKLGVELHPTSDIMAYGSWSKGYKSGGWTIRLSNATGVAPTFDEEQATTWEAGLKTSFFERRLQLNLAAFTTSYRNIQLNFIQGTSPTIRNAGDARIKGLEVDLNAALGHGLSISASAGYLDAVYTFVEANAQILPSVYQAGTYPGAPLPKSPKFKGNISARHETELSNGASVVLVVDYTHTSSLWNDTERTFLIRRSPTELVNASITYKAARNWDVTAGGTNLLNERYLTNGLANLGGGLIYGSYSRPSEWYVKVGVKF